MIWFVFWAAIGVGAVLCVLPRNLLWWLDAFVDLRYKEDLFGWVRKKFISEGCRQWMGKFKKYLRQCQAQRLNRGSQYGSSLQEFCSVLSVLTRFKQEHRAEFVIDIVKRTEALLKKICSAVLQHPPGLPKTFW